MPSDVMWFVMYVVAGAFVDAALVEAYGVRWVKTGKTLSPWGRITLALLWPQVLLYFAVRSMAEQVWK